MTNKNVLGSPHMRHKDNCWQFSCKTETLIHLPVCYSKILSKQKHRNLGKLIMWRHWELGNCGYANSFSFMSIFMKPQILPKTLITLFQNAFCCPVLNVSWIAACGTNQKISQ